VILGIEVDYLFGCHRESDLSQDRLRQQLDHYYSLGVRYLFPIHFSNNGFGGTAFQNGLQRGFDAQNPLSPLNAPGSISPLNPVGTLHAYEVQTEDARSFGYQYRMGRRNIQGLTGLGKTLIREMIARGMIIDIDHMSARSKAETLDICEAAGYPVVSGHAGFVEISNGDKSHEGQLLPQELERIRRLGGMVAVIPHQGNLDEIDTWHGPGQPVVPHQCGNSSNTLVQAYLYAAAKMQGGPVGFGTDMNGFAGLPGPSVGPEGCPGGVNEGPIAGVRYPFTAATGQRMNASVIGQKTFHLDIDGLAHIGMLPDLIADFQAMGLTAKDIEPLLNSAEGYVSVWERCLGQGSTRPHLDNPMGYGADTARVVYRGQDGHVHELALDKDHWNHWNMTAGLGAPPASGDPMGYGADTARVVYRGQDGHVHELSLDKDHWNHWNMTA
jgi:microsomal dipeptidase-like Zn-dependent dipeptidase